MNLHETLEAITESGDPRLKPLYNGLLSRIRRGKRAGDLEEILGCKAPGNGKHDAFGAYQAKVRNENIIAAIRHCAEHKPNRYHAASRRVVVELARFRPKYQRIVAGSAICSSELEHHLFNAAWVDLRVFYLKHGALYELVNPPKRNLAKPPINQVTRDLN